MNQSFFWIRLHPQTGSLGDFRIKEGCRTGTWNHHEIAMPDRNQPMLRVQQRFLVDGHVHFHDCYDEETFLITAHANLSRHGEGLPTLLLAEMNGANTFARWRSGDATWPVKLTQEPHSLMLGEKLLVIAGRQIVTAERIEVLALLTSELFADGLSLNETIEQAQSSGALVVLPWGVGKWLGPRRRHIFVAANQYPVLLGDNAGRPRGWISPSMFRNHIVLPGTDPLRLKSEQRMVGSYGFALDGPVATTHPATSLASLLKNITQSPRVIGDRVGPIVFARQQISLRLQK